MKDLVYSSSVCGLIFTTNFELVDGIYEKGLKKKNEIGKHSTKHSRHVLEPVVDTLSTYLKWLIQRVDVC